MITTNKLLTLTLIFIFVFVISITLATGEISAKNNKNLKIGVMPAVDSAPIFLAEQKGYFEAAGLNLKVQIYTNATNRQSALQSGQLDGAMTDLIAFINNIENGFPVKITTSTDGSFPFLVKNNLTKKEEIKIGMMEVSVTNFLTDRFLGEKYNLKKVFINEIPARIEMVKAGQLDMAIIPEPLASTGELSGLEKRVYENKDDFMPEAMIFTEHALNNKYEEIKIFHEVYNKAVEEINENKIIASKSLIQKLDLPVKLEKMISLPEYNKTRVPDKKYMDKVINWMEEIDNINITTDYEKMISREFIYND